MTYTDVLSDLRNKLATTEFRLLEVTEQNDNLRADLHSIKSELTLERKTVEELRTTIQNLSVGIRGRKVRDRGSQTEVEKTIDVAVQTATVQCVSPAVANTESLPASNSRGIEAATVAGAPAGSGPRLAPCNRRVDWGGSRSGRRCLILGDSHARNAADVLMRQHGCSNIEFFSFFKPNATLEAVITDLRLMTSTFTSDDIVIILGGSNNAQRGLRPNLNSLSEIVNCAKSTNVTLISVPFWKNRPVLN